MAATVSTTILLLILINLTNLTLGNINPLDCGVSKTCYGLPSDCVTNPHKSCEIIFTASADSTINTVKMELQATLDDNRSPQWFAIAFSNDRSMGDDGVFECILETTGSVSLRQSYNNGKTNKVVIDGKGTSNVVTRMNDDQIYCSWSQLSPLVMKESTFNILNTPYYLLLAKGPFSSGSKKSYHDKRISSNEPQDLRLVSLIAADSSGDNSPVPVWYIKCHGILMVISWLSIVSIAIIFARYFKESFGTSLVCGVKFWFAVHRTFMILAVIFVSTACYLSFKFVGGWSGPRLHPILGITSVSLMLLQVISALLRCSPDSSSRWIFNWIHFLTGNTAHITAIGAIFTAYDAISLPPVFLYLVGSYITLHVVTHVIMQAQSICHSSASSESDGKKLTLTNFYSFLLCE